MAGIERGSKSRPSLRLLGSFALSAGEQPVYISSRKGQLLLARLATERKRTMTRQHLAAFLWPDHGGDQARASLRQALSRLRDVLDADSALLQSDTQNVWLDPDRLRIDIDDISSGLAIEQLCSMGVFLEGVQVNEPLLQEWLETERRHMSERLLAALTERAGDCEESSQYADAIRLGLRLVSLDPLNEQGHRRLMLAFAKTRRSSRAMEQYQTLQKLLRNELDVAPEKETTELFLAIRTERANVVVTDASPASTSAQVEAYEDFPSLRLVTALCVRNANQDDAGIAAYAQIIRDFGGTRTSSTERDSTFLFGLEASLEDDPLRALQSAAKVVEYHPALAIGVALGLVTQDAHGVTGDVLRRAETLSFLASAGEILSGTPLRNHAHGWAEFNEEDIRGQKFWRFVRVRGPLRPQLPFVGRKTELIHLSRLQRDVEAEQGSVAILTGNAGIGKTRLTEELGRRAVQRGGLTATIEFTKSVGDKQPLGLRLGSELAALLDASDKSILSSMDLAQNDFLAVSAGQDPDGVRRKRFASLSPKSQLKLSRSSIIEMFDLVPVAGLTLVFDDCHWATDEEVVFLVELLQQIHAHRVFVVATERPTEEKLRPALQSMSMETPVHVTMLSPLRMSEALELARSVAGPKDTDDTKIVQHAAGNPLFTIRLAEARNALSEAIPTSVIALAQQQLDQLDERTRRLCQNAAVLGRKFPRVDAERIFGSTFVSDILPSGFVNARGPMLEFDHALIQQAIYDATPMPQRQQAHSAAAAYFMTVDAFKWAEHAVASGDAEMASKASIAAAVEAVSQNRFEVAERYVTCGLSSDCTGDERAELQYSLAEIRRDQGQIDEAIGLYRQAAEIAQSPSTRVRSLVGQAWMLRYKSSTDEAAVVFSKAKGLTETDDVSDVARCDYLAELGNRAFVSGDADAAFRAHQESLKLGELGGHRTQVARALGGLGDAHYAAFELISARQKYRECIEYSELHDISIVGNAHRHMLSYTSFFVSPGEEAMGLANAAIERAVEDENHRGEFAARVDFLDYLALDRRFEEFDAHYLAVTSLLDRIGRNRFQSDIDGALCTRALLLGDHSTLHDISLRHVSQEPTPYMWPAFAALHACSLDDRQARLNWLTQGEELLNRSSLSHSVLFFYHFASEATRELPEIALSYAERLEERSGSEMTGFAELSIRATRLRATDTPDRAALNGLRDDLARARLSGFWPALFLE